MLNSFFTSVSDSFQYVIWPTISEPWFYWPLLFVILLGIFLFLRIRYRRRNIRVFNNHAGRIHVSRRALADLVHSACDNVGAVRKPNVKFETCRGKLNLEVRVKMEAGRRLSEVSNQLQSQLTNTLQETLSLEKIGRIDVVVTGFAPRPNDDEPAAYLPNEPISNTPEDRLREQRNASFEPSPPVEPEPEQEPKASAEPEEKPVKEKGGLFGFGRKKDPVPVDTAETKSEDPIDDEWNKPASTDDDSEKPKSGTELPEDEVKAETDKADKEKSAEEEKPEPQRKFW